MAVGIVHRSINNIYTVLCDGIFYSARIKGKVLKLREKEYNPICVGDRVEIEPYSNNEALIISRLDRTCSFTRWNMKTEQNQTIVANMDQLCIVLSVNSPPFRPRFVDRAICCVDNAPIILVMNKCDYLLTEEEAKRFFLYEDLGYETFALSATTGENLDKFKMLLKDKTTAFVGQSGVGKSTLVNALLPSIAEQSVNAVSEKYNRGRHTTNYSLYIKGEDYDLIDTPGMREIQVPTRSRTQILDSFPELKHISCPVKGCMHINEENCTVPALIEKGLINFDRFESYLRIQDAVSERVPKYFRGKNKK